MNRSFIGVVFAALAAVLAYVTASAMRRKRVVDVLLLSDVTAWFTANEPASLGSSVRRITVIEPAGGGATLVRQGYFDSESKEFLRSRVVRAKQLDEELERLHASDRIVVYE